MEGFIDAPEAPIYVIGTFDTKAEEAGFIATALRSEGISAVLVDVGTLNPPMAKPDIERSKVAAHHPNGPEFVFGRRDRGAAVTAMSQALREFLMDAHRSQLCSGVIGTKKCLSRRPGNSLSTWSFCRRIRIGSSVLPIRSRSR